MKSLINKRFLAILLIFSISISLLGNIAVPASAVTMETITASMATYEALKKVKDLKDSVSQSIADAVDFEFSHWDIQDDPEIFEYELQSYNYGGWFGRFLAGYPDAWETIKGFYHFVSNDANVPNEMMIQPHEDPAQNNIVRPWIEGLGWFVDVHGRYPYCSKDVWDEYQNAGRPSGVKPFDGRWLTTNSIRDSKKTVQKSYADMDATKADLANKNPNSSVTISNLKVGGLDCKVIRRLEEGPGNRDWVWCDPNGWPYVYIDPDTQGAAQDWNYDKIQEITNNQTQDIKDIVVEQGDKIDKLIDIDTNTTVAPSVSLDPSLDIDIDSLLKLNIDKITIDRSDDRTIYSVDSHDVTYNVENNYYEYNYYTYNYEFTYNNTYVTYIGSTAEYQPKEWSMYYQLPDGRSSADLTEEDVAGLSFQFQDVINYKRASTSSDLWALYHFDGNTDDDSYYTAENSFAWSQGASINYMEANAFGGALYLDEQPHQFKLTLPSGLGTRDFSLQWRYYQNSAITSENADNYISAGGRELLRWSEKNLYFSGSSDPCETKLSIGSWQELALVRSGATLYLYHNGVSIASAPAPSALGKEIIFSLGGDSRAYSMFDELRLITRPIAVGGKSYTPTAVPYDSNSVLVLPGESAVVDSYYKWDTTRAPLWSYDVERDLKAFKEFGHVTYGNNKQFDFEKGEIYTLNSPNVTSDGSLLTLSAGSVLWDGPLYVSPENRLVYSSVPFGDSGHPRFLMAMTDVSVGADDLFPGQNTMTLTIVGANLERYTMVLDGVTSGKTWTGNFATATVKVSYAAEYDEDVHHWYECCYLFIQPKVNSTFAFRYVELVPGSQPNTGHQLVTDTYDPADLQPNTAAVQTDIPIKGYTVGGVRPTFPSRGDVWFPAEGNRISGVQVYNGQAWEETNARWWTGKRWIPIYAFDLVTLADMWDVGSSSGQDVTPTITSDIGFWNWWKNAWNGFVDKFFCKHDYKQEITKPPTCQGPGTATYICTKCGKSYVETLEAVDHDWQLTESVSDTYVQGHVPVELRSVTCGLFNPPSGDFISVLSDGDLSTFVSIRRVTSAFGAPVIFSAYAPGSTVKPVRISKVEIEFEHTGIDIELQAPLSDSLPVFGLKTFSTNDVITLVHQWPDRDSGLSQFQIRSSAYDGPLNLAELRAYYWGDTDEVETPGYDVYTCSYCGMTYKDETRTGPNVEAPITNEFTFWNWWKGVWTSFSSDILNALSFGLGPGGSGETGDIPDGSLPGEEEGEEDETWHVWDLLVALKDGSWAIVKGTVKTAFGGIKGVVGVVTDIGGFFTSVGEVSDTIKDFGGG